MGTVCRRHGVGLRRVSATLLLAGLLVTTGYSTAMTRSECEAAAERDGLTEGRAMQEYIRRCTGTTSLEPRGEERAPAKASARSEGTLDKQGEKASTERSASTSGARVSSGSGERSTGDSSTASDRSSSAAGERQQHVPTPERPKSLPPAEEFKGEKSN